MQAGCSRSQHASRVQQLSGVTTRHMLVGSSWPQQDTAACNAPHPACHMDTNAGLLPGGLPAVCRQ
jgi:hypothetical protein